MRQSDLNMHDSDMCVLAGMSTGLLPQQPSSSLALTTKTGSFHTSMMEVCGQARESKVGKASTVLSRHMQVGSVGVPAQLPCLEGSFVILYLQPCQASQSDTAEAPGVTALSGKISPASMT
jgi:hypothetical protein